MVQANDTVEPSSCIAVAYEKDPDSRINTNSSNTSRTFTPPSQRTAVGKRQKRNKPSLSCEACTVKKTKVCETKLVYYKDL